MVCLCMQVFVAHKAFILLKETHKKLEIKSNWILMVIVIEPSSAVL